jgi:negative regulator of sigma E activity
MWGPTIIGFGNFHYKYASGHEGDSPLIGFSPRKAQFSLYVYSKTEKSDKLLKDFGKFKMGKSCIYVKKLADIDISILEQLCAETIENIDENGEYAC